MVDVYFQVRGGCGGFQSMPAWGLFQGYLVDLENVQFLCCKCNLDYFALLQ